MVEHQLVYTAGLNALLNQPSQLIHQILSLQTSNMYGISIITKFSYVKCMITVMIIFVLAKLAVAAAGNNKAPIKTA